MDDSDLNRILSKVSTNLNDTLGAQAGVSREYEDNFDRLLQSFTLDQIIEFHDLVLPYSSVSDHRTISFNRQQYELESQRLWDRSVLEIRFRPLTDPRIESDFAVTIPIRRCEFTTALHLYPPRSDIMFEFHQDLIAAMVETIFSAGEARVSLESDI